MRRPFIFIMFFFVVMSIMSCTESMVINADKKQHTAFYFYHKGEYEKSLKLCQEALSLWQEIKEAGTGGYEENQVDSKIEKCLFLLEDIAAVAPSQEKALQKFYSSHQRGAISQKTHNESLYDGSYFGSTNVQTLNSQKGARCLSCSVEIEILNSIITGSAIDTGGHNYEIIGYIDQIGKVFAGMAFGGNTIANFTGEFLVNSGTGKYETINHCCGTWQVARVEK